MTETTQAIAVREHGLELTSFDDMQRFALAAYNAGILDGGDAKRAVATACMQMQAGAELGLRPMESLRGIDIIKGKPAIGAALIAARMHRFGYRIKPLVHTNAEVALEITSPDGDVNVSSFSMEDARKAGLASGMYGKYPRNMLHARAVSNAARWFAPEVFNGAVYTPEELTEPAVVDEPTPEAAPDVIDVEADPPGVEPGIAYGESGDGGEAITRKQHERMEALIADERLPSDWNAKLSTRLDQALSGKLGRQGLNRAILAAKAQAAGSLEAYDTEQNPVIDSADVADVTGDIGGPAGDHCSECGTTANVSGEPALCLDCRALEPEPSTDADPLDGEPF